jgi:hypothetical protein
MTSVPVIIRNQRPRKWPTMAMRICILCSVAGCGGAALLRAVNAPYIFTLVMAFPIFGGFGAAFAIAVYSVLNRPIDKLLLGDGLEIWPGKTRFAIAEIQRVEFVTSLEEDFDDNASGQSTHVVEITVVASDSVHRIGVTLNTRDVLRLADWLKENRIRGAGANGPAERGE